MSHLARIIDLKEELAKADFNVEQQMAVVANAYVVALSRQLFAHNDRRLCVTEQFEEQMWSALNMWNRISPVKGGYIVQRVKQFINGVSSQLMSQCTFEVNAIAGIEGIEFSVDKYPTFETLVATLMKEFEEYIYHGEHD